MEKRILIYLVLFLVLVGLGCIDHNIPGELKLSTLNPPPKDWGSTCFAPSDNDTWVVSDDEVCTGGKIVITRLRILPGGSLTLRDCDLVVNGSKDSPGVIEVLSKGSLSVVGGRISGSSYNYIFYAHRDSIVNLTKTSISNVGVDDGYPAHYGMYLGGDYSVFDSQISNNYVGLVLGGFGDVRESIFSKNDYSGIYVLDGTGSIINNQISDSKYGIYLRYFTSPDKFTIQNNYIYSVWSGIYIDPTDCGDGICDKGEICAKDCSYEMWCSDNVDNDEDKLIDCKDDDCIKDSACSSPTPEPIKEDCSNEIDDDGDGLTDCGDSDCSSTCLPSSEKPLIVPLVILENNISYSNGVGITVSGVHKVSIENNRICGLGTGIIDKEYNYNSYKDNICDSSNPDGLCTNTCSGSGGTTCEVSSECSKCGLCLGEPLPCEKLDKKECTLQEGCTWDSVKEVCLGKPVPCSEVFDCSSQLGCYLGGYTDGKDCYLDSGCKQLCSSGHHSVDLDDPNTFDPDGDGKPNIVRVEIQGSPGQYRYVVNDDVTLVSGKTYNIPAHSPAIEINCSDCVFDCNGSTINGTDTGTGIEVTSKKNVTVRNCTVMNYEYGIYWHKLADDGSLINNNLSSNRKSGLWIQNSSNVFVTNNTATNNGYHGIYIVSSFNDTIKYNFIDSNKYHGIYLLSGYNISVINNTLSNNLYYGIIVYNSSDDFFSNNHISKNNVGLYLTLASYHTVVNNTIENNTQYGIYLQTSSRNSIYNNNICYASNLDIYLTSDSNLNSGDNTCDKLQDDDSNNVTCSQSCPAPQPSCCNLVDMSGCDNITKSNNDYLITGDVRFCKGDYYLTDDEWNGALIVKANNINVYCDDTRFISTNGNGIGLDNGAYAGTTVRGCTFVGFQKGVYIHDGAYKNKVIDCTFINNTRGIQVFSNDEENIQNITGYSNTYCIDLWSNARNILVSNAHCYNNTYGVVIGKSNDNIIEYSILENNTRGIWVSSSSFNKISHNNMSGNSYGVVVDGASTNNSFVSNLVRFSKYTGVSVSSDNNTFSDTHACFNNVGGGNYYDLLDNGNNTWQYSVYDTSSPDNPSYFDKVSGCTPLGCVNLSDPSTYHDRVVNVSGIYYINKDVVLCRNTYTTNQTLIVINQSNITLDCNSSILQGNNGFETSGITFTPDWSVKNVVIKNCEIRNFYSGIYVVNSSNINVTENTLMYNTYGIYLETNWIASYVNVYNNNITENSQGIRFGASYNNLISNNHIYNNQMLDIDFAASTSPNHYECVQIIENNTANGLPLLFYNKTVSLKDKTVAELILCNADGSFIRGLNVHGSDKYKNNMLYLIGTDNTTIINSNSSGNYFGIRLSFESNNNKIINSTFATNGLDGIHLQTDSNNNYFENCITTNNDYSGVTLQFGVANNVFNNTYACFNVQNPFAQSFAADLNDEGANSGGQYNNVFINSVYDTSRPDNETYFDKVGGCSTPQPTCCNLTDMSGCDNVSKVGDSYYINGDTELCSGEYHYTGTGEFIIMNCTNCTLDCAGSRIIGSNLNGWGVGYSKVCEYNYTGPTLYQTIKNCEISGFDTGISESSLSPKYLPGSTCYLPDIQIDSVYSHNNKYGLGGLSNELKDKVHIMNSSFKDNCVVDVRDWDCHLGNVDLIGSLDLPIIIRRDSVVNLTSGTYTEILLCNVSGEISNITVVGSNYNNLLRIDESKDMILSNINITRSNGLAIYSTNDTVIRGSRFEDNAFGLFADRCWNITVVNNTIVNNAVIPPCGYEVYGVGIYLYRTNKTRLLHNQINGHRYFGVLLNNNTAFNNITNNVICGNGWDQSPVPTLPEGDITEVSSTNNTFQDNKCDVSNPSGYCVIPCREQNCTNNLDDDNDSLVDCDDPDCYGVPSCEGILTLDLIEPTSDITIPAGSVFQFKVNVSCLVHNCGNVNVTLDPPSPYDDWNYMRNITVDHNKIYSDLTDFPVLVVLNSSNFNFSKAQPNGEDIRFTDANNIPLSYEIEYWNTSNERAYIWVKLPKVFSTEDTIFYMYYGNPDATDDQNISDVWSNHYIAVYHMGNVVGGKIKDSSPYDNTGFVSGDTHTVPGSIGDGLYFDGGADYIKISSILGEFNEHEGTIELYANFDSSQNPYSAPWGIRQSGKLFEFTRTGAGTEMYYRYPHNCNYLRKIYYTPSTWEHWSFTWSDSGSFGKVYKNGTLIKSGGFSSSCLIDFDEDFFIGATDPSSYFYYRGYIDEFRVSDVARSDAWLGASYYSEENQLLTIGEEEAVKHGKGAVPEDSGQPFYTISHNPATPYNTPCLANMRKGESCLISWTVVDVNDTTAEFYAVGVGENAPENESRHINVTVSGNNSVKPVMINVGILPPRPDDDEDLTCSAIAEDNDTSTLVIEFEWYLGNIHVSQFDNTETCASGSVCNSSVVVPSSVTRAGEDWTCRVRAFDGSYYSDWMNDTVHVFPPTLGENCTNGIDDDNDNLVDCRDPDCYGDPACVEEEGKSRMDVNRNDTCMGRPILITVLKHDSDRPVEEAKVYVNTTFIGFTDEDGQVVYVFNTTGPYEIVVRHEDYRTYHDNWAFTNCTLPSPGPSPGENETVSECTSDEDCFCNESCVNGTCQPVECGEGYVFDPNRACHTCSYAECLTDDDCPENESCENGVCALVSCSCGVIENHTCNRYECCLDSECDVMQVCLNHTCVPIQTEEGSTVSSDTIRGLKSQLDDLYKRARKLHDAGEISDKEYHEYIQRIEDARRALSEGRIDYVEMSIQKVQVDLSPMKRKITNLIFLATILIILLFLILLYKRRKEERKNKGVKLKGRKRA